MPEKLFLLTNDDGRRALGLRVLADILGQLGKVVIVAPETEQSACSHSITLNRPLRINTYAPDCYTVDGTTTDCVLLASQQLLGRMPDAVFSGINHGPNLGDDVTYSGTVAGAFEGTLLGVQCSMAISSGDMERIEDRRCQEILIELIGRLLDHQWPEDVLLNINLPPSDIPMRGIRVTRLGRRHYAESVIEKTDPRGKVYYWIGGMDPRWYGDERCDFHALADGYISVTPMHLDLTHYPGLDLFKTFEKLL
ncbi:MAG: 5'/3'-nucleotidase SurE [Gemmatimonadota bacterium]|nr:5'/3'-nucleotidase SurE [Gemmatimonadota bacterium]